MAKTKKKKSKSILLNFKPVHFLIAGVILLTGCIIYGYQQSRPTTLDDFQAKPFNIVKPLVRPKASPKALVAPAAIKSTYKISGSGSGTIAIVNAYDAPTIENDLATFSNQYGLPACTTANGCFEKVKMSPSITVSQDWSIETSLDVQWAHAIAPGAKILLVEANSASGTDLINAIKYAKGRAGVVAISMSWGGDEFSSEAAYESTFTSNSGIVFLAASGDSGHGTSWPSVSANVISVGGTSLTVGAGGTVTNETAWTGSGGGLSSYIKSPARQSSYGVPQANGRRATPDVAYNADPNSGYPVYSSTPYSGSSGWFQVGGTSAGSPQWAGLVALSGKTLNANQLYIDGKTKPATFKDIVSGNNGRCGYYCNTRSRYDYVTGLGSPLTAKF